jgi:glycosyltransferase involved in cell wall biosynthesis
MSTDVRRQPRVTVGLPVFNGGRFLGEAMDSLLAQDFADFEIVICDDASTDETAAIYRRYAALDSRIRIIRNPVHVGGVGNFRRALVEARGELFTWLAQDDLCDATYLSRLVEVFDRNQDAVSCLSGLRFIGDDGAFLYAEDYPDLHVHVPWPRGRQRFFLNSYHPNYHMTLYALHRTTVLASAFDGLRTSEDGIWDSWDVRLPVILATRGRIVAIPEVLRSYRLHDGSWTRAVLGKASGEERAAIVRYRKGSLLRIAMAAPLPLRDRWSLMQVAIANFSGWRELLAALSMTAEDGGRLPPLTIEPETP